jgi:hypothetical protein
VVPLCAKQEVDRVTVPVDRPVQILPFARDFDISFVRSPTSTHRALATAKHCAGYRQDFDGLAVHGGVIDTHTALGHDLLDVTQAQLICSVPAHAHQHYFQRVVHPLDHLAQRFNHLRTVNLHQLTLPARAYCDRTGKPA